MSQVGTPTDPSALSTVPSVPETDPFADLSAMFGDLGAMPASTGAGMGQIESLTSEIVTQLTTMSPDAQAAAAGSFANLFEMVAEHVATVDLADPAAVADLEASFSQMVAMAMDGGQDTASVEFAMLAGIADSAYAAVTIAAADPALAETVIEMVTGTFAELSETFLAVSMGAADFAATSGGALDELLALYPGLVGLGAENGIEITSLGMEQLPPVDDPMAPAAEGDPTGTSEMDDLLGDLGLDAEDPTDPMDPTAELPTDETGVDEMLSDGEAAEMDDLLGELGLDPEGAEATDEVIAEDGAESGGLSADSSTDGDPSAENQAKLEARYIGLYESLMEKQISFKEAIEPYKTDNQNAGKG